MENDIDNELVRYSRAGDTFHYRWAARRCIKMIYPSSPVKYIVIEGTNDRKRAGEYVIDVSEYLANGADNKMDVNYYQLKHTTVQKDDPFSLGDINKTITGFADKYKDHINTKHNRGTAHFFLVTNRTVAESLKENIRKIVNKQQCGNRFLKAVHKYTDLTGKKLIGFFKSFTILDEIGDYNEQRWELQIELSNLLIGSVEHPQIDTIISLVTEKALPDSDGKISPEEILQRFGCTSVRDMYPAPAELEDINDIILPIQHQKLVERIIKSQEAIIIHAAGGVGKSVFAKTLPLHLMNNSIAIIYDCFGAGRYRTHSQPRHRHRDGLIQIINEIAGEGLCDPVIAQSTALADEILRTFLTRLQIAINNLRTVNNAAQIIIAIDAADNAEMAAIEFGEACFAHELLREQLPDGCCLVMLCRTERIHLLQPGSSVETHELLPFSEQETLSLLRKSYPSATEADGLEFHRLTNGNPRVQANTLHIKAEHISDMLETLGPASTTVDAQIENQLDIAVKNVKDKLSHNYKEQIDAICCGLASLPPFIPIKVLSTAAKVDESTVKSFVADLGRPLWITESVIQFRDEPTEYWFRQRFAGDPQQFSTYIALLEPLADKFTYVAEVLPLLYLQAKLYPRLIELALSDKLLPCDNPIDKRNVRIYRLQFAFKAALREKQYSDAIRIALLAGEEMAGNKRQLEIFKKNVDLIAPLQDTQKVQEIAFKRLLCGSWEGSENIYSASLLSNVQEYHGEAHSYLRASNNWLHVYFEERDKNRDEFPHRAVEYTEIAEMAFAYYNLYGIESAVRFIIKWKPRTVVYYVACVLAKKMIDLNWIGKIRNIAKLGKKEVFLILALVHELLKTGIFLDAEVLDVGLEVLSKGKLKLPKIEDSFRDNILISVVSFAEACALRNMSNDKVIQLLRNYFPDKAPNSFSSNYSYETRDIFLRVVALRKTLCPDMDVGIDNLLPEKFSDRKKDYRYEQDIREYKEFHGGLLPWYLARSQVLLGDYSDLKAVIKKAQEASGVSLHSRHIRYDTIGYEISQIYTDILLFCNKSTNYEIEWIFKDNIIDNEHIRMDTRLNALRGANRLEHLSIIRSKLDEYVHDSVKSSAEDTETRAEWYIGLARATIPVSVADAAEYFNIAIEIVSRFGDEIVDRWQAIASLANRSCDERFESAELAYRFIRCAELVGENVAREKYFARNEAVKICTKLSPSSGLAAMSRWRDRDVGWFENQFPVVTKEIVEMGFTAPNVAWSLSPFLEESSLPELVCTCLVKEPSSKIRTIILDSAIDYLRLYDTSNTVWQGISQIANDLGMKNEKLDMICSFYSKEMKEKVIEDSRRELHELDDEKLKGIFMGLDLTIPADIDAVIRKFRDIQHSYYYRDLFWKYFYTQIADRDIIEFFNAFVMSEQISVYIIEEAFPRIPEYWKKKPSVKKKWPDIIRQIAKSLSANLLYSSFRQEQFLNTLCIENSERCFVYEGMIEGLLSQGSMETADAYYGFVAIVAKILEPAQARELLDFSIARFELHMEDDFADGKWANWLIPPGNPERAVAGFIWSALGSPSSEMRWRAAHSVRRLGENECKNEIDALVEWLNQDSVGAFGYNEFPFYNLHARLYLFIAFARLSIDKPELLREHASVFSYYTLCDMPHILIQKFAAKTALNIESVFPGTYEDSIINLIQNVAESPFPIKEKERRHENIQSYLHQKGSVNVDLSFSHGYDFDRYWFEPLGRVFGISGKHVEELATMVLAEEWGISNNGKYIEDPRQSLWNSTRYDNKTYHSHGEYPSLERYDFYLSYHAMLAVASRLLQNMPVLFEDGWDYEDPWQEWLMRHSLSSDDGLWLFDRRDTLPLRKPRWLREKTSNEWVDNITEDDFLEALYLNDCQSDWLNVCGSWEYGRDSYRESVYIASAIVSREASQALLNALSSCENPHDYKLPDYEEERMEFSENPFKLRGWIIDRYSEHGIDKADKLSGQVYYPAYRVGETIAGKISLSVDKQSKNWCFSEQEVHCITCQSWSYDVSEYSETEQLLGKRLCASLGGLKALCIVEDCELIIEVQIRRRIKKSRNSDSSSDGAYIPPKHKIYVFSREGELRDEKGSVSIRQIASQ